MEAANKERKAIEKIILTKAVEQISNSEIKRSYTLVKGKGWHKGVIGIIASRLKDLYARLCVAITIDENVAHGSIRSTEQIDLTKILHELKNRNVLISGGGHKQAAGFSLLMDKLNDFDKIVTNHVSDQESLKNSSSLLEIDGMIDIEGVNNHLINNLSLLGPYGSQVPQPVIVIPNCQILFTKEMGEGHLLCKLKRNRGTLDAVCFNARKSGLDIALSKPNQILHIAGNLVKNEWQGVIKPQMPIVAIPQI
jgi:single-stranded-DNA-specific exonuclease